jgi:hypothetical protein
MRLFEPFAWIIALFLLWMMYPAGDSSPTLCLFHHIGISWCPGCGIGRSMSHFLHGNIQASIQSHWFGIPAVLILGYRILQLVLPEIRNNIITVK